MTLGDKLREFGLKNYSSLTDFSVAMGMKLPSLHQYITGKREPGAHILRRLNKLGCDINWLLSDSTGTVNEPAADYRQNRITELEEKVKKLEYTIKQIERIIQNQKG